MPSEQPNPMLAEMARELSALAEDSQLRTLALVAGVNFCSNDYLGLAEDARLKQAVIEAVQASARVGGTGSRLLSGHHAVWTELEEEFAAFAGTEAALYFSSGYAANVGLLASILGKDDLVFSDALNHASLIDGIRLSGARRIIYPHLDLQWLQLALQNHENRAGRKVIVTESVFSMDGDISDVKAIHDLADRYGANLVVDEAHATAVHGPRGAGIVAKCGLTQEVFAVVHTCGKALASAGAFVCGSTILRDFLVNHARTLIFSTAMPPYMAGQISAALRLAKNMNAEREMLLQESLELAGGLSADGWNVSGTASQIIPVIIGGNDETLNAAEVLRAQGFAIRAIRPPTVPIGGARLRLSLTAQIAGRELARMHECLNVWRSSRLALSAVGAPAGQA
jgi:8-amino-7-oxononanoate synthase